MAEGGLGDLDLPHLHRDSKSTVVADAALARSWGRCNQWMQCDEPQEVTREEQQESFEIVSFQKFVSEHHWSGVEASPWRYLRERYYWHDFE